MNENEMLQKILDGQDGMNQRLIQLESAQTEAENEQAANNFMEVMGSNFVTNDKFDTLMNKMDTVGTATAALIQELTQKEILGSESSKVNPQTQTGAPETVKAEGQDSPQKAHEMNNDKKKEVAVEGGIVAKEAKEGEEGSEKKEENGNDDKKVNGIVDKIKDIQQKEGLPLGEAIQKAMSEEASAEMADPKAESAEKARRKREEEERGSEEINNDPTLNNSGVTVDSTGNFSAGSSSTENSAQPNAAGQADIVSLTKGHFVDQAGLEKALNKLAGSKPGVNIMKETAKMIDNWNANPAMQVGA